MNDSPNKPGSVEEIPKARERRKQWRLPVVWVVPVIAAIVAGYLVYNRVHQFGPKITIRFKDAGGLLPGLTQIRYRGVAIGEVKTLELSEDRQHALVKARLRRWAEPVARERTVFWIVRPEVGIGSITGLGTVVTGPQIEASPGTGKPKSEFTGLDRPPAASERKGLKIVLLASRLGSLKAGAPVYYRGIEVGAVQDSRLGGDATTVNIHVFIRQRYAGLIRTESKFWNASGVDISAGLFRGLEINVELLRSLVAGGIAFATPNDPMGVPAKNGTVFRLYDEPRKDWLEWAPKITIPPEGS